MTKKNRVNKLITATEVMVIDTDGTKLGIIPISEAIDIAKRKDLDLVEVSPNTSPPVCKVMNFGKYKYKKSKKDHSSKKKQKVIRVKEVKMTPTIGDHDYQFKLSHLRKFLADGDKVKVTIVFKGRMISHKDLGLVVLRRIMEETTEIATIEQEPKSEGNNMVLLLIAKNQIPVT